MNKYDFNDLAAMLRNGASDEEIAEAFSENLNLAKAEEAKRKAEEAAAKELEAKKLEEARTHREQAMQLATNAAAALNVLLIHEDILRTGEVCFTAEDLLDTIDEARKETANIRSLIDSLADLWNSLGLKSEVENPTPTPRKCKDNIKPSSSDEEIFNELFNKLFK